MRTKGGKYGNTNRKKHSRHSNIRPKHTQKGATGCPPVYDPVRFPHIAHVLCKTYGFTQEQLGKTFGVSHKTVEAWMQIHEDFRSAVKEGKSKFDSDNVVQALLKRALGYSYKEKTQKKVWIRGKDMKTGVAVMIPGREIVITEKQVPPDVKACMYWLTNRMPEEWKMQVNISADIKNSHTVKPAIAAKADLSKMNKEQLMMLRELVNMQQENVIDITPEQKLLPIESILDQGESIIEL